ETADHAEQEQAGRRWDEEDEGEDRPELFGRHREPLERVARGRAFQRVDEHAPPEPHERAEGADHQSQFRSASGRSPPTRSMNNSSRVRAPAAALVRMSAIAPCATSRPDAMTPMCVDSRSTISRMCEVRKTVPPLATNECSSSLI